MPVIQIHTGEPKVLNYDVLSLDRYQELVQALSLVPFQVYELKMSQVGEDGGQEGTTLRADVVVREHDLSQLFTLSCYSFENFN